MNIPKTFVNPDQEKIYHLWHICTKCFKVYDHSQASWNKQKYSLCCRESENIVSFSTDIKNVPNLTLLTEDEIKNALGTAVENITQEKLNEAVPEIFRLCKSLEYVALQGYIHDNFRLRSVHELIAVFRYVILSKKD